LQEAVGMKDGILYLHRLITRTVIQPAGFPFSTPRQDGKYFGGVTS